MISLNATLFPNGSAKSTSVANSIRSDVFDYNQIVFRNIAITISLSDLIVGILGNLLVLLVFCMRYSQLKTCEIFMANLAGADLIGTITCPTKHLLVTMETGFKERNLGYKFLEFTEFISESVSALTLVLIAIDRFAIVKWPLRSFRSPCKIAISAISTRLIGLLLGFICLASVLEVTASSEQEYMMICNIVTLVVQVIFPSIIIIVLYTCIFGEFRKSFSNQIFEPSERDRKLREVQNWEITKLSIVIIVTFYICVLPYAILVILYLLHQIKFTNSILKLHTCLEMLKMFNSSVNPILYSRLHKTFRRMMLHLFCSSLFNRFISYEWAHPDKLRKHHSYQVSPISKHAFYINSPTFESPKFKMKRLSLDDKKLIAG